MISLSISLLLKLKCFTDSDLKLQTLALEEVQTGKILTIVNIHGDYPKSNTKEPWVILKNIFDNHPNLILCADFNLTLKNECYFRDAFVDFTGNYNILQTPEPVNIGNPTYDMIISNY